MSIPALSWMSVMVGDPLYRPYAAWLQIDAQNDSAKALSDWKTYHEFTVKNAARPASEFRALAAKAAVSAWNCPMLEDLGSIAVRDRNFQRRQMISSKRELVMRTATTFCGWSWKKRTRGSNKRSQSALSILSEKHCELLPMRRSPAAEEDGTDLLESQKR